MGTFHSRVLVADLVIAMEGILTIKAVRDFRRQLMDLIGDAPICLTIECSQLQCPHNAGTQALVEFAGNLIDHGGELRLLNPSLWLARELRYADTNQLIRVVDS